MSPKVTDSTFTRPRIEEKDRCRFTSAHGRRCLNPLRSGTAGFCIIHERFYEESNDAEAAAVSDQLFSGGPELRTPEDVGRVMAQLFTLIAQRRIKRSEGTLLAYVGAILLQTMGHSAVQPPQVRVICDIPRPHRELNTPSAQQPEHPNPNARFAQEPQMRGRTYDPYMHPSERK
jgi:hypothetical protein